MHSFVGIAVSSGAQVLDVRAPVQAHHFGTQRGDVASGPTEQAGLEFEMKNESKHVHM